MIIFSLSFSSVLLAKRLSYQGQLKDSHIKCSFEMEYEAGKIHTFTYHSDKPHFDGRESVGTLHYAYPAHGIPLENQEANYSSYYSEIVQGNYEYQQFPGLDLKTKRFHLGRHVKGNIVLKKVTERYYHVHVTQSFCPRFYCRKWGYEKSELCILDAYAY